MTDFFGFLNIDKSAGMTSHDVVAKVRRGIRVKKVGHAGTLDPMATGVLVLCVGKATRLSEYVMAHYKVYEAEVYLGVETDTYDAEGTVTATSDAQVERAQLEAVLPRFRGTIEQVPPMYSAIKQGGKKLYELARRGETVERPARQVSIEALSVIEWDAPRVQLRVTCSPGTYIRSLAHDIGVALGIGAHLSALRRLASGQHFRVENAVALDQLQKAIERSEWQQYLLAPDLALLDMPRVDLDESQSQRVRQGGFLNLNRDDDGPIRAYDEQGCLLALMEKRRSSQWKPSKVFG